MSQPALAPRSSKLAMSKLATPKMSLEVTSLDQVSQTLAGVVAVDGGTIGLDVNFGAFLAVILGLFIPVVFLITLCAAALATAEPEAAQPPAPPPLPPTGPPLPALLGYQHPLSRISSTALAGSSSRTRRAPPPPSASPTRLAAPSSRTSRCVAHPRTQQIALSTSAPRSRCQLLPDAAWDGLRCGACPLARLVAPRARGAAVGRINVLPLTPSSNLCLADVFPLIF